MPYLPTSQAFLEQSAELLQAYPEAVSTIPTRLHANIQESNMNHAMNISKEPKLTAPDPDSNKIQLPNNKTRQRQADSKIASEKDHRCHIFNSRTNRNSHAENI